ncbi:MAG: LysR family transcriptional regulator [Lachnospiraceae bacterium]|nr:LysR family transcriptional regulator [Clostridiales bacterium]MCC8142390.1 LysR family transcriptional regulator [Lachnospiraceae bacterium]
MAEPKYLHINLLQMQYFLGVASCSSFTKAAQLLYTTQSTLSKTISSLEQTLDVTLFIRSKKQVTLTEAGQHLYDRWSVILRDIEKSLDESRVLQGGYNQFLAIGILDSQNSEKITAPIVRGFLQKHPLTNISVSACQTQELQKSLVCDNLDIVFTVLYDLEQMGNPAFDSLIFDECPHSVCMLADNPLASRETLTVADLKDSHFVGISPLYLPSYCGMLEDLCVPYGFRPQYIRYAINAMSQLYNLIEPNDIFICDQNYNGYNNPDMPHLQFRPLIDTHSGVAAVWKKSNTKEELKMFIDQIRTYQEEKANVL